MKEWSRHMVIAFDRFKGYQEQLNHTKHQLHESLACISLDVYREGIVHSSFMEQFDTAMADLRRFIDELERSMHSEPLLLDWCVE